MIKSQIIWYAECDNPKCRSGRGTSVCESKQELREYLFDNGWQIQINGDETYCPKCHQPMKKVKSNEKGEIQCQMN